MSHFDDQTRSDLTSVIRFLDLKGKEKFGKHFKIYSEDYEVVHKLLSYFINDTDGLQKHQLDPDKGILLSGPVGCGKTSLMRLFRLVAIRTCRYEFVPGRSLVINFSTQGFPSLYPFMKSAHAKHLCIDDIGIEPPVRYFGDQVNVIGEVLLSRYELHVNRGLRTHATTNLSASELEMKYGLRVRSRLREMFNLIGFDPESSDKRSLV